jgi:hypothetical protein
MPFFTSRIAQSTIEIKIEEIMQKFDFNTAYITLHLLHTTQAKSESGQPLVPQNVPLLLLRDLARKLLNRTSVAENGQTLTLACFSCIRKDDELTLWFSTVSYNTAASKFDFGATGNA